MSDEVKFTKEGAMKTIAELKATNEELVAAKTIEKIVTKNVEVEKEINPLTTQSDALNELADALANAQIEFVGVGKDSEGHGYDYADLDSIVMYAKPIIAKQGLSIAQMIVSKMHGTLLLSGVRTILMHKSGQWLATEAYCPTIKTKMNSTVQILGVNTTYIRRYQYQAMLGLTTVDTDGVG